MTNWNIANRSASLGCLSLAGIQDLASGCISKKSVLEFDNFTYKAIHHFNYCLD